MKARIFPNSSIAKRLAVRAMRAYSHFIRSEPTPLQPTDSRDVRILIQSMGGIGNTLMATPLIAATRRMFPNGRVDLLTSPGAAALVRFDPNLSNVHEDSGSGSAFSHVSRIRSTRYDAAIVALNAHLSQYAMRIVFGRIPRRLMHGYAFRPYDDFSPAYTHVLDRPEARHDVMCNIDLLEALTGANPKPGPLQITIPEDALSRSRKRLKDAGWREGIATIALCQGSSEWMSFKRWPLENAIAFADLTASTDRQCVVFCGPEESLALGQWNERFADRKDIIVMAPMPLTEYAAALSLMSAVVANDSLPMHIAAALQVPIVALFGPTDPTLTGPWMCRSRVIQAEADYAPYYELPYPLDPGQFPDCMVTIEPVAVLQALDDLLSEAASET